MKDFVTESRILRCRDLYFFGGRKYREFEIASEDTFEAGQYLMIRTKTREVNWPYPYFIHSRTVDGLAVLAREDQELYNCVTDEGIECWGPRGMAPAGEAICGKKGPVLVTEPAVYFAVYPFVCRKAYRRLIVAGAKDGDADVAAVEYCGGIKEAAKLLDQETGPVIAALNPDAAKEFAECITEERKKETYLFVSNKKACGIDGCKGCYLHGGDTKFGINVCCKGPFMPLSVIDFEADGRCFEAFL